MNQSHVALIGCGGSSDLACNLARCGLGRITLVDPDAVDRINIARQGFDSSDCGKPKVDALGQRLGSIDPTIIIRGLRADFCTLTDAEIDKHFGNADLLIFATDHFPAQARGNEVALRLRKIALWIGLYAGAGAGELVYWRPGLPCFRCLCSKRYEAQAVKQDDPASDGADIFSIGLLDAIAGQVALGLLTAGADNRYGRLIDQLDGRNFIQVQLDPAYRMNGRDIFREQLGIPEGNDRFFAWNAITRRDPQGGLPPCPACIAYGHRVGEE